MCLCACTCRTESAKRSIVGSSVNHIVGTGRLRLMYARLPYTCLVITHTHTHEHSNIHIQYIEEYIAFVLGCTSEVIIGERAYVTYARRYFVNGAFAGGAADLLRLVASNAKKTRASDINCGAHGRPCAPTSYYRFSYSMCIDSVYFVTVLHANNILPLQVSTRFAWRNCATRYNSFQTLSLQNMGNFSTCNVLYMLDARVPCGQPSNYLNHLSTLCTAENAPEPCAERRDDGATHSVFIHI